MRKSEEQKRNLRVDLKRIPEWQSEQKGIRYCLYRLDLIVVKRSADLTYECAVGYMDSFEQKNVKKELDDWKSNLSHESLLELENRIWLPRFLKSGKSIANRIYSAEADSKKSIVEAEAKGVTGNFLVSLVTGRTQAYDLETVRIKARAIESKIEKIPQLIAATETFTHISRKSERYLEIDKLLDIAFEKKEAIERFEAKHGNAFAKAASVDKKARNRAASLKRLVDKTATCPYCAKEIGSHPHLDHIYPVAAGGLSMKENLIWCCADCNSTKSDRGLIEFLLDANLPVDSVILRLRDMGKRI